MKNKKLTFGEWLDLAPSCVLEGDELAKTLTLNLDLSSWIVYSMAAKHRGETLEQVIEHVLMSSDDVFEENGYRTSLEVDYEKHKAKEAARLQPAAK
jgi:hypothetical protein